MKSALFHLWRFLQVQEEILTVQIEMSNMFRLYCEYWHLRCWNFGVLSKFAPRPFLFWAAKIKMAYLNISEAEAAEIEARLNADLENFE